MKNFQLDPQLKKDCFALGKTQGCHLLLFNNAQLPWFILVPEVEVIELYQLTTEQQLTLLSTVNRLSEFVQQEYNTDKINVASIGNVVAQFHMHVVGRKRSDFCWPGVVWGQPSKITYTEKQVEQIKKLLLLNQLIDE